MRMRGVVISFGLWLCYAMVYGQNVQWAGRVIGVSSEGKGEAYGQQYRASQALGRPSKLPQMGETVCAWAPLYPDSPNEANACPTGNCGRVC